MKTITNSIVNYGKFYFQFQGKISIIKNGNMCCNLRTHAMVISIICLIFTGLGSLNLISTFAQFTSGSATSGDVYTLYGGNITIALGVQILIYVYWFVSEILCLVGAIKNNKCLLIPFMICLCLTILGCVGVTVKMIILGSESLWAQRAFGQPGVGIGGIIWFLMIIPIGIVLGLSIYFLVIIVKFYNELKSGVAAGQREGVVLQPYASPSVPPGGGKVVYTTPGAQNMSYPTQQYPPHQQPNPTYSQPGYQPNTHGIKNSA